jgi:hypothetical protein
LIRPRDGIILAAIVLVAAALAAMWLIRMPIFENPDENTHADYAFVLLTTGHLIRARDGLPATDVHPYTRYLKAVGHVAGIRFNNAGRVPPDYGTSAYDRRADANAPIVDRHAFDQGVHTVPYVALVNSFVYYALDATAMRIGYTLSNGSLVAAFRSGRALGILFLAIGLISIFLLLRERRVPPGQALALVAAIGWLPQVSWLCASVQPDNLGFAAVPTATYLALRSRRLGLDITQAMLLGLALALTTITKVAYGLAVTLAIVPLVALLCARLPNARLRALAAFLALAPSAALLAISLQISYSPYFGRLLSLSNTHGVLKVLPVSFLGLFDYGRTSLTFWHAFGISQMISLGDAASTAAVHIVLVAATLVVLLFMIAREGRVIARLVHVAKGRSLRTAALLACGDVVLVSYVWFIAIMTFFYAVTLGLLGAGRYFMPFIAPALLCGIWYMPQLLSAPWRRGVRSVILVFLIGYSLVEAAFSWGAIERRYYTPPSTEALRYEENGAINAPAADPPVTLARGTPFHVAGWTFDSTLSKPARSVIAVVDHERRVPMHVNEPRNDIELLYHDDDLLQSGFSGWIETGELRPGEHVISIEVVESTRSAVFPSPKDVTFRIR